MTRPVFTPEGGLNLWIPIPCPGKVKLMLGEDHSVRVGLLSLTVPENFSCDGASIPRPLKLFFPESILLLIEASALYHDYAYRVQPCTRFQADAAFRSIMDAYGVPRWAATTCFLAVRAFGWRAWNANADHIDANRRAYQYDDKVEGLQNEAA